jgi:hypothetical protein
MRTKLSFLLAAAVFGFACTADPLQPSLDAGTRSHENPDGWVLGPDCVKCTRAPVSRAFWEPARVVLVSGNVGASGEYQRPFVQSLLLPDHAWTGSANAFVSAKPHPPPYDDEIYALLDARGIAPAQAFDDVQFASPEGVVAVMTIVPADHAPEFRTVDFDTGPAITGKDFPLAITATLVRNGIVVAPATQATIPDPGDYQSHLFLGFAASSTLNGGPSYLPPDGSYEYRLQITDSRVTGWNVTVPFTVGNIAAPPTSATDVKLTPDATGFIDGTNAAGVRGSWWATGDLYGTDGSIGGGACPLAGFPLAACSVIMTPTPGQPWMPTPDGAMCTTGVAAPVMTGSDGQPAWSSIWGTLVGFNLAEMPDPAGGPPVPGPYDAVARGFVGFAFDLDGQIPIGHMRVDVATVTTNNNAAYWMGATSDVSPVGAPARFEVRWPEVGGPMYLGPSAPPFDPREITSIRWQVVANTFGPVPYSFCIRNVALLTK